jgi:hypothetical protein
MSWIYLKANIIEGLSTYRIHVVAQGLIPTLYIAFPFLICARLLIVHTMQ